MSVYDVIPVTAEDYRKLARRRLPRFLFDYVDGAANDEESLARNEREFSHYRVRQFVMRDVSNVSTETTILGSPVSMPVALAPVGFAGMMRRRGEVQAARAAKRLGIPFAASTVGICTVEEIRSATGDPCWFQLYMLRDREFVKKMLSRAEASGCETLLFTVDLPVAGMRLRDFRNGMLGSSPAAKLSKAAQLLASPLWIYDVGIKGKPHGLGHLAEKVTDTNDMDAYKAVVDHQFDPTVTWEDIGWVREQWKGKLVIKGVMEAGDAVAAVEAGADGVIVSNHGGRQLDGVAATIEKLPDVVAALDGRAEVYVDGGIRNGIDVVKAIALGARAVLIGRPWVWAMAARGEQGIVDFLGVMQKEIATAMALMGVDEIGQIGPECIERAGAGGSGEE